MYFPSDSRGLTHSERRFAGAQTTILEQEAVSDLVFRAAGDADAPEPAAARDTPN